MNISASAAVSNVVLTSFYLSSHLNVLGYGVQRSPLGILSCMGAISGVIIGLWGPAITLRDSIMYGRDIGMGDPLGSCLEMNDSILHNGSRIYYRVGASGGFHIPLSVMPLKSDGSLCIIEALCNRSQDCAYFVSKTGGLSGWCNYEHNRQYSLDLLQEPFREQEQDSSVQTHHYFSGLPCQAMFHSPLIEETKDTQLEDYDSRFLNWEKTMPYYKNWVASHFSTRGSMEQQMTSSMVDDGAPSGSVCPMVFWGFTVPKFVNESWFPIQLRYSCVQVTLLIYNSFVKIILGY
ncbi:hypothetical protein F3Y22_tig00110210pilonHSYRG00012 [Hibiscus syriacus]|uniref:Uncharacterized protein n=1 Tax=Hibiscus syriacus TaxID=106335 RepID=A0A6A3B881_HIBSY|nr:hypothetical protein F3Y22_tig00110210pilonHSYRG00012 [Hibiscus syriacus]